MLRITQYIIVLGLTITLISCQDKVEFSGRNIMIFTYSNGYQHESREYAANTLKAKIDSLGGNVIVVRDSAFLSSADLTQFDAIVFLSTGGDPLGITEQQELEKFVKNGGGFVGIHGASATEYEWKWYGKLIGAFFDDHPKIQSGTIRTIDKSHVSTLHLPDNYKWDDEWYNWRSLPGENVKVLLTVDESTYDGGNHGDYHPISWCQEYDGGKSWYTALGHKKEHYNNIDFIRHILGGVYWVSE